MAPGEQNRVEQALGGAVARVARASSRFPKTTILLYLVVTMAMAGGLSKIYVRSADYDLLPNHHPSTVANVHALNEVPGYRSIETLYVEVADPHDNITNESSVRAAYAAQKYMEQHVPGIAYSYNLAYLVRFINYTASGIPAPCTIVNGAIGGGAPPPPSGLPVGLPNGTPPLPGLPNGSLPPTPQSVSLPGPLNDTCYQAIKAPDLSAFEMPNDSLTFQRDWTILFTAAPGTVEGVTTGDFTGMLLVFMYDVNLTRAGPPAVLPASHQFLQSVQDFKQTECPRLLKPDNTSVWNCGHVYVLGEGINAHLTDLANEDFKTWGPVVFLVTLIVLVFAFDFDLVSTLIAFLAFTMGLVWTYGFMGYSGIPLTFFGLLIVPITLGVGKEYAIYITNQILDYGSRGMKKRDVMDLAGRRAGGALLVASVTSVAGLATMYLADFKVMQDLAVLSIFSFLSLFLLSITFIPAAHAVRRRQRAFRFRPSAPMRAVGAAITRRRAAVAAVLIVGTLALAAESTQIEEYFGISGGFQKGDYLEVSYEYYNKAFGGSGTELAVVEGDVADPSFIGYLRGLDASFKNDTETIPKASNVNSLIIALETYYSLKDGLFNPAALNGQIGRSSIPNDKAELQADMRGMFGNPVFGPVAALFIGPDLNIAVTHVFYHIKSETFQSLEEDWNSLNADVARVPKPSTVHDVNLVGTQDTFYLYVKYGQPWLGRVTLYASVLTFLIAAAVLRKPRDIAAVMMPMLMAGVWWAGLLPLFDIKASLTLMLPTVFLISVGSDYAIQYVWNYRQIGDMAEVYASTGKANFYVVLATVIAFLLFVPMKLVLSSQGALAAALAILTIFGVTTMAVPLFYSNKAFGAPADAPAGASQPRPEAAPGPAPAPGMPAPAPGPAPAPPRAPPRALPRATVRKLPPGDEAGAGPPP